MRYQSNQWLLRLPHCFRYFLYLYLPRLTSSRGVRRRGQRQSGTTCVSQRLAPYAELFLFWGGLMSRLFSRGMWQHLLSLCCACWAPPCTSIGAPLLLMLLSRCPSS